MPPSIRLTALLVTLSFPPAEAQVTSTVVRESGRTLEVVGLRRWTLAMVQDSIDKYAPGMSLFSHGCAATLRVELKFAEAASFMVRGRDPQKHRNVVFLIEPQDSALVRHRALPRDTTGSTAPWTPLVSWVRAKDPLVRQVILARIQARGTDTLGTLLAALDSQPGARARAGEIQAYLDRHATAADAKMARRILAESPYLFDRVAAVAILSSFDKDDTTWWALAGALLETDGSVRARASDVLAAFAHWRPRPVEWRPAAGEVHAILNGGNFWALPYVLNVLVATGAGPELAAPFLRDGGHAVLLLAGMEWEWPRNAAHRLLRTLSGADYGGDISAWRAWIGGL